MSEDDKMKEGYLEARGWVRVDRPIPYLPCWMLAWRAADRVERILCKAGLSLEDAVTQQLRWDARGLVFFLDSLDDSNPKARKRVGAGLLALAGVVLKDMLKDQDIVRQMAYRFGEVMRDMEDDPAYQANVAAVTRAYEIGRKRVAKGQAN